MAIETPFHRHRLDLRDDFHLIDSAMAGNAADAARDVDTMVEVHEVREIMNAFPHDRVVAFKAHSNRFKQSAFRENDAQVARSFGRSVSAMTVAASRRGRDRRMPSALHRVMTITAVHLQLTGMEFVTERNRLLGLMTNVNDLWIDRRK